MLNRYTLINLILIPILLLLQVFVFNNIYFFHKYNPIIYIIWIIFYPYDKSFNYLFLIFSFLLGFGIDCFMDTGGVNAFSSVLISYIRNTVLRYISDLDREMKILNFSDLNFLQLLSYIIIIILIHHLSLFILESFKISMILDVIEDALITSVFSFLFIIIIYAFFKNKIG
ncbi:rod shape-determining protein MreD [Apibacter sp. wkB309]|nr:rod shape-determining protein MreD [Apibacter sp. wkB309]